MGLVIRDIMNYSAVTDFTAQTRITDMTFHIAQISLVGFVAFAVASFIFAMMVSHRVAGPTVGITAVIEELKKGNRRCWLLFMAHARSLSRSLQRPRFSLPSLFLSRSSRVTSASSSPNLR